MLTNNKLSIVALLLGLSGSAMAEQAQTARVPILAIVGGGALTQGAPANQRPLATNAATGAWAAPIGHEQPTQKDLPPSKVLEEGSPARNFGPFRSDFGPFRSICRGC
jgi:hypothetical protein